MRIFNYLLTTCLVLNFIQAESQCNVAGSHYTASYPTGWNVTDMGDAGSDSYACNDGHNGSMYLTGTAAYFISARGGRELRASTPISAVNNNIWTMDFTLIINPSFFPTTLLPTNSPAAVLAALTSDQMSLQSSCTGGSLCAPCGSYANTNMDAMWIYLTSNAPNGCVDSQTGKAWRIVAAARDGSGPQNNSTAINIPTGVAGTYYIRFQRTYDQAVVSVFTNSDFTGHLSGSPQCLSIPGSVTDLDVLSHEVMAQETCTRTLNGIVDNLKIDNSVPCALPLNPSFTMGDYTCGVQPFTVNGSASTTTNVPISQHRWVVEECNAGGSSWFGPVWYSPVITGAPSGDYWIYPAAVATSGPTMQAGHYYRVSLVLSSCGNPWISTSKIIHIYPLPVINMAGSSTVALSNNLVNIQPSVSGGAGGPYIVTVSLGYYFPGGTVLFAGPPGSNGAITQYSPTTYYVKVFDDAGCSSQMTWLVGMPSARPAFNVELTSQTADAFTLKTIPEDVTGYDYPDFSYSHVIEELALDGTALYSHTSEDCWTSYPDSESFKGFMSSGKGIYEQASDPDCGDPGRFLKGHRYRLTTVMQTSESDQQQYSVIVSVDQSGQLIVEQEEKSASAMKHMSTKETSSASEITIFPNPSTGIYTIQLEEASEGSLIEITNALGQKVKAFEVKGLRSELNLTGFTKGIYIVTISSNGSKTTKKIILE
jgi:hypothetical protein